MRGGRAGPLLGRELYAEKAERDLYEKNIKKLRMKSGK